MLPKNNGNENKSFIFSKIRQFVHKLIRKRVPNSHDAEDITQNTLIKVYSRELNGKTELKFESIDDAKKYFTKVAINETNRYFSEQKKNKEDNILDEISNSRELDQIKLDICYEYLQLFYGMPLKQKLSLILKNKNILQTFRGFYSLKTISELLEINEIDLLKIEKEIPVESDDEVKRIIELMIQKELKTTVRDERWKARNYYQKKQGLNKK